MGSGLLLAFPLESVALRLAVALGVALVLLRVLSARHLRSPHARTMLALTPFVVAAVVILLSLRDLALPALLVPTAERAGALALPVADRYLDFAPVAPVVIALWAATTLSLVLRRIVRTRRFREDVLHEARPASPRVAAIVVRLSRGLAIGPPRVLVVDRGLAGAAVLGVRDPILLLDARALELLDDEEFEGVVAHELAHIARRDNMVAWAVALVRDVVCFIPGAGWAVRALHREREAAADQAAAEVTGRPAALASGLLRVVEDTVSRRRLPVGCAALAPATGVVERVRFLLEDRPVTVREHQRELGLSAVVGVLAVLLALIIPSALTGSDGQRDALGVLVNPGSEGHEVIALVPTEGRVFSVYRRLAPADASTTLPGSQRSVRALDLIGAGDRAGAAAACGLDAAGCASTAGPARLVLQPAPIVLLENRVGARWQATPVLDGPSGDRVAMYWLARLP
jgi:beta-lactamase regulating signal transducer with metallopeptidase domain